VASFGATPSASAAEPCTAPNLRGHVATFWFVPDAHPRVHFSDAPGGPPNKKYVVRGDLLLVNQRTATSVCASYVRRSPGRHLALEVVAVGWIEKSALTRFDLVDFGSFDVDPPRDLKAANAALSALAKALPSVADWRGRWVNRDKDEVTIWKKGPRFELSLMGLAGAVGTGNRDEDSRALSTAGAKAWIKEDPKVDDVCDVVIVGFNNALLATSGAHCLGSGADHTYPQFTGIYWKK